MGLARGRAQPGADRVTWVTADVTTWSAEPASLDLVLVAYLHLPEAETDRRCSAGRSAGCARAAGCSCSGTTSRT